MQEKSLILTLLLTYVTTENYKCGDCLCSTPLESVTCVGENIIQVPNFTNTHWITHVAIRQTNITSIEPLIHWNTLSLLEMIENELLDCEQVFDFETLRPDVFTVSMCSHAHKFGFWMALIVIIHFIIGSIAFILKKIKQECRVSTPSNSARRYV